MIYSATALRKNIYAVLDSILESGIPVEIERHGKRLKIIPEGTTSRLARLEPHDIERDSSVSLENIHWDQSWNGKLPE